MQKSNDYVSESSKTKEDSPSFNAKVERLAQSEPFQNIITSLFCHNVNANSDEGSSKVEINVGIPGEGGIGTSDLYAVMPPFEAFAGISAQLREKLFLQVRLKRLFVETFYSRVFIRDISKISASGLFWKFFG